MDPYNQFDASQPREPQSLRESWHYIQRLDPKGQPCDDLEQYRTVSLSPQGSIVEKVWARERDYHCGHDARKPRGGRCGEEGCFNVSCQDCFTRCGECQVGLCLFHVRYIKTSDIQRLPVCSHCQSALRRRRFWHRFWAALLRPFVTFEEISR